MKTAIVCLIALLWVAHSVLSAPADGPPPDTVPSTAPVPEGSGDLQSAQTFGLWGWGWPFWGGYGGGWGWGGRWGWGGGWGGYGGGWW